MSEEDRVVILRFGPFLILRAPPHRNADLQIALDGDAGNDWDPTCMKMDETLYSIQEKIQNFAVIYLVDIVKVPDFNKVRLPLPLSFDTLYPNLGKPVSRRCFEKSEDADSLLPVFLRFDLTDVRAYVPREFSSRELSLAKPRSFPCPSAVYDPCTVMFFYRNKHIMIDLSTGNNNKMSVPPSLPQLVPVP